jgi:hypothetical protein
MSSNLGIYFYSHLKMEISLHQFLDIFMASYIMLSFGDIIYNLLTQLKNFLLLNIVDGYAATYRFLLDIRLLSLWTKAQPGLVVCLTTCLECTRPWNSIHSTTRTIRIESKERSVWSGTVKEGFHREQPWWDLIRKTAGREGVYMIWIRWAKV